MGGQDITGQMVNGFQLQEAQERSRVDISGRTGNGCLVLADKMDPWTVSMIRMATGYRGLLSEACTAQTGSGYPTPLCYNPVKTDILALMGNGLLARVMDRDRAGTLGPMGSGL